VDDSEVSDDELPACIRILRAIEADRAHLMRLTREERREFLTLASVVAKPDGHNLGLPLIYVPEVPVGFLCA